MTTGRPRPTHVEVPLDVLRAFGEAEVTPPEPIAPVAPDPQDVQRAVDAIEAAERVVIYAGGGAVASGAHQAITALAERLVVPVLTSIMVTGSIAEDQPMALGNLWEPGSPDEQVLTSASLAAGFGSHLGAQDTEYQRVPLPSSFELVGIEPVEF